MVRIGETFVGIVLQNGVSILKDLPMKPIARLLFALSLCYCLSAARADDVDKDHATDAAQEQLLVRGISMMHGGDPAGAIRDYFDKVIAANDIRIAAIDKKVYAARTMTESLLYLLEATRDKTNAVVLGSQVGYAHFMKAYALVELHMEDEAKVELDAALALSPHNSQFLGETGGWYLRHKDWDHALQSYRGAQEAASMAPPESQKIEQAAAWRGIGYVDVEQHRLADAEQMYLKCLELDANDQKAANELKYVRARLQKEGAH